MAAKKNLVGRKFGLLTVIRDSGFRSKNGGILWVCDCDCGNTIKTRGDALNSGATVSCGCWKADKARENFTKHGCCQTLLYKRLINIKTRCYISTSIEYENYGGRGIFLCRLWRKDFLAFKNWAENNGFREDYDIDRIDNDGPYAPWNCRFVPKSINNLNKRAVGVFSHKNGRFYAHVKIKGKKFSLGGYKDFHIAKSVRETHKIKEIESWQT